MCLVSRDRGRSSPLHTCRSQQRLACLQIRHLVRLALRREGPVRGPQVNQRLHGLEVVRFQQIQCRGGQDEVAEAAIELLFEVEMVEWVDEVSMI